MVVCIPSWCRGREVKISPILRQTFHFPSTPVSPTLGDMGGDRAAGPRTPLLGPSLPPPPEITPDEACAVSYDGGGGAFFPRPGAENPSGGGGDTHHDSDSVARCGGIPAATAEARPPLAGGAIMVAAGFADPPCAPDLVCG